MKKQIEFIVSLNNRVHNFVKNPYLKLFFIIMIESRGQIPIKELLQEFFEKNIINLFDLITVASKFLNDKDLGQILQDKIDKDIEYGNLEVLALIGLNSERAVPLL